MPPSSMRSHISRSRSEALLLAAERLNGAQDPEQVLLSVVQTAAELLSVEWAAIATNEGDHALRRYTWDDDSWNAHAERLPLDESLSGWVIRHRKSLRRSAPFEEAADDGAARDVRFHTILAVPIVSRDGMVLGSLNLHKRRDGQPFSADDQRQAEALAHHAALALERARMIAELRAQAAARDAQAAEQDAFIHTVAHALKNPLSSILATLELLSTAEMDGGTAPADGLGVAARNAERMRDIIEDLLGWARTTAGLKDLVTQTVELDSVLDAAQQELLARLQSSGACLTIDHPLPAVLGHAGRLTEAFVNLIDNAVKYTAPERQPEIHVSATVLDGMVCCAVTDNGIGVPTEEREQIFQLFRRLDGARTLPAPGSGVGLAVVARIVEAHGGRIWVEDGPGGGSRFLMTLPAVSHAVSPVCQAG